MPVDYIFLQMILLLTGMQFHSNHQSTCYYSCRCFSLTCNAFYLFGSVKRCAVDIDGLRHLLLCRVILGRTEVVAPGSEQCHPSSEDYDSGVDNLSAPTKYVIWCSRMNTHVLPEYVISFRIPQGL